MYVNYLKWEPAGSLNGESLIRTH